MNCGFAALTGILSRKSTLLPFLCQSPMAVPCRIDMPGFKDFMEGLTKETGQPLSIMSELLILSGLEMQTLQSGSALDSKIEVDAHTAHCLPLNSFAPYKSTPHEAAVESNPLGYRSSHIVAEQ